MTAPAVGIDLGTTYSCIAVYRNGKTEVITNEEGNRITSSCVAFTNTERLIGDAAKNQDAMNAENTIFDIKRLIGRKFDDSVVQADIKMWPFTVINDGGKPKIRVQYKGQQKTFSPEEISAMVLTKMKEIGEAYLGKTVKNAVITVPAYFNNSQRQTTKDAGKIAGLNVLRVLNEPTAGALAFGIGDKREEEINVLIYDLGGGTFDVTILTIEEGIFDVRATAGDTHLGGEDFDNRLLTHCVEEFHRKHQKNLEIDKKAIRRLRTACERAKRVLSNSSQASIDLELLFDGKDFHTSITRARFEDMNSDLFKKTIELVKKSLQDAKMKISDIHEVVLVGGSTRIPMVQTLLQELFGGKTLNKSVNPDEAVACGAAIQAAIIEGDESEELQELLLTDVTPFTLGIAVIGDIMDPIIKRNSNIPHKMTKPYFTVYIDQTRVRIDVYEGERTMAKENKLLGTFDLNGITPTATRGSKAQLDVTFEIDTNGILNVTAVELFNKNNSKNITINHNTGRLTKDEIERMIREADMYRKEDADNKELVMAKVELESYCRNTKLRVEAEDLKGSIRFAGRESILRKCNDTITWLESANATKTDYKNKLIELKNFCDPLLLFK